MRDVRRSAPTDLVKVVEAAELRPTATPEQRQRFEALYRLLFPRLFAFAQRSLDRNGAFDAVQEAIADIWSRWPDVVREKPSSSFFFAAVRNQVATAIKRMPNEAVPFSQLADELPEWPLGSTSSPGAELERAEFAAIAEATVATMPKRCREVWVSMRENGMRYTQVAGALGLTEVTVRRHMMRALQLLHEALADAGYREAIAPPPKLLPAPLPPLLPAPASPTAAEEDAHD
jgi:RNA polymerase sigma-19 factor, ECF subfamily